MTPFMYVRSDVVCLPAGSKTNSDDMIQIVPMMQTVPQMMLWIGVSRMAMNNVAG